MNFSISGVNFQNKGAELMLYAVKQQLHQWDKNNTLSGHLTLGTFEQRKQVGINHLASTRSNKITYAGQIIGFSANLIPKTIRKKYNITLESEVNTVLDASGFAFSDQWGSEDTEKMAKLCSKWKKQGKRIILLPQAFGPFTGERIRKAFVQIVNDVDLIFARDEISYKHISQLSVPLKNVKIAPDFTNLVQGIEPDYIKNLVDRPCIIPNCRMLDKTSSEVREKYIFFLTSIIEHLLGSGIKPFILIHETKDYNLGTQIQAQVSQAVPVIQESNPLYLKGILGKSYLVISSRFHGLISALSQQVPCLGTGWSHKYQMLFESYNCLDLLVDIENNLQESLAKLDLIIHEPTRARVIEAIAQASENQKTLSREMWIEVKKMLAC